MGRIVAKKYSSNPLNIGNLKDGALVGITSPPYADQQVSLQNRNDHSAMWIKKDTGQKHRDYGNSEQQIASLPDKNMIGITSPPYQDMKIVSRLQPISSNPNKTFKQLQNQNMKNYNPSNPLNIGNLKDGTLVGITSPPYSEARDGAGIIRRWQEKNPNKTDKKMGFTMSPTSPIAYTKQNNSKENIASLPDKNLIGITSPPYDNRLSDNDTREFMDTENKHKRPNTAYGSSKAQIGNLNDKNLVGITSPPYGDISGIKHYPGRIGEMKGKIRIQDMGIEETKNYNPDNPENLGNQKNESYLQAMLQVYREASKSLPIIVTVTKNPTRNGRLRRLDIDTANLLMMSGYHIIDYHRAVLFEERRQATLNGGIKNHINDRLSFFKRLSVQKGNIAAQWEDVIIATTKYISDARNT